MADGKTLQFTDSEITVFDRAYTQLMGARSAGGKGYKPTFKGKHYAPGEEELGAIAFLYDELERQIAELRNRGDNTPDYTNALKTIEMHRTVVTLIGDQVSRMIDGYKGRDKEKEPNVKEWEELFLKLHGLLTCQYFESFDLNVKTNINRILGTKVMSMNQEHIEAALKDRNYDENVCRHLTLAMKEIEAVPTQLGLAQAMRHAGEFMKKLDRHAAPPSGASGTEVLKRCAVALGNAAKELDKAVALEDADSKQGRKLAAARDTLTELHDTLKNASHNKANTTAFLAQPETSKEEILEKLNQANQAIRAVLAPKRAMMVLTGIAEPTKLFSTDDPGEDLEAKFCHAAFAVIGPLQDIRDLLYQKLGMKEARVSPEAVHELAEKSHALGLMLQGALQEKEHGSFTLGGGGSMAQIGEMNEIMRRTAFAIGHMTVKRPSADSAVFVADAATEHAMKEWLNGTVRKNIVRFYEMLPEKQDEKARALAQYDDISGLLKTTFRPALMASKPRLSRSGKRIMDEYNYGCAKGEYMTPDVIALEGELFTRQEHDKKHSQPAQNSMLAMMAMGGSGMGGLGGIDPGGFGR